MLWKLRRFLFGTQFVHLENSDDEIIRAIKRTGSGEPYCVYSGEMLIFIDRHDCGWTVTRLTI